jgi:hypothetical protein
MLQVVKDRRHWSRILKAQAFAAGKTRTGCTGASQDTVPVEGSGLDQQGQSTGNSRDEFPSNPPRSGKGSVE